MLTDAYGLYYNKDMFAKAGIAGPPKTMTELMADAKKLTVRNADGSIKIAGFVPLIPGRSSTRPTWRAPGAVSTSTPRASRSSPPTRPGRRR